MGVLDEGVAMGADESSPLASLGSASDARGAHHKRRRNGTGYPSGTRGNPIKSTAEVMAALGLTEEQLDSGGLRCGVGGVVPLRGAAKRLVADTVKRYSAVVPVEVTRVCLECMVQTQDRMLEGHMSGRLLRLAATIVEVAIHCVPALLETE